MGSEIDRPLVLALKRGQAAAFDAIYAAHRHSLYSYLVRLTGRKDLAEDLFQETWIRLATNAARLEDDTHLAAWLFTVAHNQYRSQQRAARVDGARQDGAREASAAALPSPAELLGLSEAERHLEMAIERLSPAHREVLLLVAVEGLAQDEIAQVLGIEHAAVRQRLTRARAKLSEELDAIEMGSVKSKEASR
ncbi:MAG: RNA polymerase sigma factor [Polyangiaceae bacterium]